MQNLSFLPVFDASKEELLATWESIVKTVVRDISSHPFFDDFDDYRAARLTSKVSGADQPTITSHSVLARAQYSF